MMPYAFPDNVLFFRVEPETRSHYFRVYVWPTLKTMRAYVRTFGETTLVNRGHAFTLDWTVHHRGQVPRGLLGEMHFARRYLSEDFISHEALHAALIFARWKGIDVPGVFTGNDPKSRAEERLCYALGSLTAQVTATAQMHGYL